MFHRIRFKSVWFHDLTRTLFVGLVVFLTTIWIALAVHCHVRRPWLRWFVSCVPLTIVGASMGVLPFVPWALTIWLALMVITITWWFSLRRRSDGDWAEGMEVLPRRDRGRHAARAALSQL